MKKSMSVRAEKDEDGKPKVIRICSCYCEVCQQFVRSTEDRIKENGKGLQYNANGLLDLNIPNKETLEGVEELRSKKNLRSFSSARKVIKSLEDR